MRSRFKDGQLRFDFGKPQCPIPRFHTKFQVACDTESRRAFAVEVRSENDYGPAAERRMAAKRRDYFDAGTLCVWDVDVLGEDFIKAYHSSDPDNPILYRQGEIADAGEAVPGWSMSVDELRPDEG